MTEDGEIEELTSRITY